MAMLRSETARLGHRDPRQRRRAIRALFDLDDPKALPAFEALLEDEAWFRSKAIDAIRRWYPGDAPDLADRLATDEDATLRRLAAEVAPRRSDSQRAKGVLERLSGDSDDSVRLRAWESLLVMPGVGDDSIARALEDESAPVRIRALEAATNSGSAATLLGSALDDRNERVVARAIDLMSLSWKPSTEVVARVAGLVRTARSDALRASALSLVLSNPEFEVASLDPDGWRRPVRPILIDALVNGLADRDCSMDDGFVDALLRLGSPSLLPRLLRRAEQEDRVRVTIRLLLDDGCEPIVRMRLIEDLVGRPVPADLRPVLESIAAVEDDDLAPLAATALAAAPSAEEE